MSRSGDNKRNARPLIRILPGAKDYPASLLTCGIQVRLNGIGETSLLRSPVLALFCSVKCPGSVVLKTYEAMQGLKLEDRMIAGGFHSPMERTCLDILLRGRTKLIVCPARGLGQIRLRPEWRTPLSENRFLLVSPFDDAVRRSTVPLARTRNRFVGELAEALLVPFAARKSRTEQFVVEMLSAGKTIFTFPDPEAQPLIDLGARLLPL